MCLEMKFRTRFCAPYDIAVYKMLEDIRVPIRTPYQGEEIIFNDGVFEQSIPDEELKPNMWGDVHRGIHSLRSRFGFLDESTKSCTLYYAVIPAGTPFYVGKYDDVVSSRLLIFESMDYFNKYEAENGKARPLKVKETTNDIFPEGEIVEETDKVRQEALSGYVSKKELLEWADGEIAKLDQYDRYESGLISGLKKLIEHLEVGK